MEKSSRANRNLRSVERSFCCLEHSSAWPVWKQALLVHDSQATCGWSDPGSRHWCPLQANLFTRIYLGTWGVSCIIASAATMSHLQQVQQVSDGGQSSRSVRSPRRRSTSQSEACPRNSNLTTEEHLVFFFFFQG